MNPPALWLPLFLTLRALVGTLYLWTTRITWYVLTRVSLTMAMVFRQQTSFRVKMKHYHSHDCRIVVFWKGWSVIAPE